MPKLPVVSAKQLVKFFESHGYKKIHQRGSHIKLTKKGAKRRLVIPNDKEASIGVILTNLKTAGISRKEFIDSMQKGKKPSPK